MSLVMPPRTDYRIGMDFADFKSWAMSLNSALDGSAPSLVQWRELLARMEAVGTADEQPRIGTADLTSLPAAPPPKCDPSLVSDDGPQADEEREMTVAEAMENERQDEIARRQDPEGYRRWQEESYAAFPDEEDDAAPPPVDPDMAERLGATATEAVQLLRAKGANRRAGRR